MLNLLKRTVQHLLAVVWVRRCYETTMRALLEVLALNRFTSLVYSVASIPAFNREQFAVLRGQRDYYRNLTRLRVSRTELRRNIHRLEKGILMRPRRPVFALDYLLETIEFYERAVVQHASVPGVDIEELTWAHAVLREYFSIVEGGHPVVEAARTRFAATRAHFDPEDHRRVPYERAGEYNGEISYEQLLDLAIRRRSVRWFEQRAVPRELIDKALLVARQSPSACNRLPYVFRIFDDPEMVEKVCAIPVGTAGYGHQIPTVAVVVGRLNHYFSARDRHVIYVDSALASMPFLLALETLGLSSSIINWPDFEPLEGKMQKALGLDYDERVIMLIAIGYADSKGLVAHSEKKPLDGIRSYNQLPE